MLFYPVSEARRPLYIKTGKCVKLVERKGLRDPPDLLLSTAITNQLAEFLRVRCRDAPHPRRHWSQLLWRKEKLGAGSRISNMTYTIGLNFADFEPDSMQDRAAASGLVKAGPDDKCSPRTCAELDLQQGRVPR